MEQKFCIGFLGADWWGSDARATAMELRRQGHVIVERNYEDYFPTKWRGSVRILRRLFRRWMQAEYNNAVRELLKIESLDFLLAFKGMLLQPETLQEFRNRGIPCYCLYPDVSFQDHGNSIWKCASLYDCVFTTKSYHLEDPQITGHVRQLKLVRHGFDAEVHRPIPMDENLMAAYGSDVSFVGVWSPKKEATLLQLTKAIPEIDLKIWGPAWERSSPQVQKYWQGRGAYGDETSAIYSLSRINLGLLSEAGTGTHQGDQTTARTWQIPACGAFMLHEHTKELETFFETDREVITFSNATELAEKVGFYLANSDERGRVQTAAYERCHREPYTYQSAVNTILAHHADHA